MFFLEIKHQMIKNILFINLANVGDVVLSSPITRILGSYYEHAKIDILVTPQTAGIAEVLPNINRTIVYDKFGKDRGIMGCLRVVEQLRKNNYQLVLTTNQATRSSLLCWLCGAKYRIGFDAQWGRLFLTHAIDTGDFQDQHNADFQSQVLHPLGIVPADTALSLNMSHPDLRNDKDKLLPELILCPAGRSHEKEWPVEGFSAVIEWFSTIGKCYLIGGAKDKQVLEKINRLAGNKAEIFAGSRTLGEIAQLINRADLMISVDTGPAHIAEALNTPCIVLFGPSSSKIWGPRRPHSVIIKADVQCIPCQNPKQCPNPFICMSNISVDEVIDHANRILGLA